jgi:hypothetical protein
MDVVALQSEQVPYNVSLVWSCWPLESEAVNKVSLLVISLGWIMVAIEGAHLKPVFVGEMHHGGDVVHVVKAMESSLLANRNVRQYMHYWKH